MSRAKKKSHKAKALQRVDFRLFARKSGKHRDKKKTEDKKKCRKKVEQE